MRILQKNSLRFGAIELVSTDDRCITSNWDMLRNWQSENSARLISGLVTLADRSSHDEQV